LIEVRRDGPEPELSTRRLEALLEGSSDRDPSGRVGNDLLGDIGAKRRSVNDPARLCANRRGRAGARGPSRVASTASAGGESQHEMRAFRIALRFTVRSPAGGRVDRDGLGIWRVPSVDVAGRAGRRDSRLAYRRPPAFATRSLSRAQFIGRPHVRGCALGAAAGLVSPRGLRLCATRRVAAGGGIEQSVKA